MHIIMKNQNDGDQSTLCIERVHDHAEIIGADPTQIAQLEKIAQAVGAPGVYMIVHADALQACLDAGWVQPDSVVVVWKDFRNGKAAGR